MWCPGDIVVRSRGELLASLEDTASTQYAACGQEGLEDAGGAGQLRGCGCEAQIVRRRCWRPRITPRSEHHHAPPTYCVSQYVHPPSSEHCGGSSCTLLRCAAKRVRTASGCGEAAAELRACARGDVWSSGRVASPNFPNTARRSILL
jgi:hypothetical protein